MKKNIPAVFFQKKLNGAKTASQKPERLELFENDLRDVVGGMRNQGTDTYSGSDGWADVANADDCGA
jgi:hypothetical protein